MPSVFAIFPGPERATGACELYRVTMPLWYLAQYGRWNTGWAFAETLLKSDQFLQIVARTDLFIFPRMIAPDDETLAQIGNLFEFLRVRGKKVVYEVDDDYTNEHRKVANGDALAVMRLADALTVTTTRLGKRLLELTGRPYYVLPNCLDPKVWRDKPREKRGSDVHIILSGSSSHKDDWQVLADVLPGILGREKGVRLSIAGFIPDYLSHLPNTTYYEPAPYPYYAHLIRSGDIVLAPVVPDDGFNLGKSPIKAVEGMGAARSQNSSFVGAAVIATDMPVYREALSHGKNGLLVDHTPDAWRGALQTLIADADLRHSLQKRAYRDAWARYNIAERWKLWDRSYRQIIGFS